MAINFTGGTQNQSELEEIQMELYAESNTLRDGLVDISEGHKSGADVYESSATVSASAATTTAVSATGDIDLNANKTGVSLVSFQFEDTMDDNALKGTRFERSMKAGAFNVVSDEFDQKVLVQVAPAIGEVVENMIWNGATTAQKALIAGLTPAAGQGSISAGAQTLAAAMPTNLVNSLPATILHNASNAKASAGAGIGDYIKVPNVAAVSSDTIAEQYARMYGAAPSKVINSVTEGAEIFAPLGDRQLIKIANNAVGAAQQVNFLVEGDKISYNGHTINFVPLVGFRILALPSYLKILMDLASDVSSLEIDKMANGSRQRFIKNVQTMTTWVVGQKYITLYGG